MRDLESRLHVDTKADFLNGRLSRAGLIASEVSNQNRIVDRHDIPDEGGSAQGGFYWVGYDFKSSEGTGNLLQFPLSPVFEGNPFAGQAFEHVGSEIIFSLPNGLQAYFLVDGQGRRIDNAPVDVVRDALKTAGTPVVINGLSCMACHRLGINATEDTVRAGTTVGGRGRVKVDQLFPEQAVMGQIITQDQDAFLLRFGRGYGDLLEGGRGTK